MSKTFPSLKELEQISRKIKGLGNQKGEFKRKIHYGCYLLCSQSGLRISEAIKFDLNSKTKKGLYRINKPKKQNERLVYVSKEVVRELKKQNWKPNQTNRHNFYHFLRKIKQKANISPKIELTPHTFRRAFTTYHAEQGTPLPLLQKLLGHSSIRTTALYWQNIYGDNDPHDILAGKKWLEQPKKPKPSAETVAPSRKNLPENLEPLTTEPQKPAIKPTPPLIEIEPKPTITNYKPISEIQSIAEPLLDKGKNEISPKSPSTLENFSPSTIKRENKPSKTGKNFSKQLSLINQKQTSEPENFLLAEIKNLKEQLAKVQTENKQLKIEKAKSEATAKQEKERADNYQQQLKKVVQVLSQQSKVNYYQKLERQVQVEQPPKPPPNFKK